MYKGWIKCSENFQRMAGFNYEGKQKRHGLKWKYFGCEVTDSQLQGMKENWEKLKNAEIEWDLNKKVDSAYGVKEGEVLLDLIGYNHYFFSKYTNITRYSKLKEWKTHNGLYYSSDGKYVSEGFIADRTHIRDDCSVFNTLSVHMSKDTKQCAFDVNKIDLYIEDLQNIKQKLISLYQLSQENE